MIEALSNPRYRSLSIVFLGICCILALLAAIVGISDNLPGILLVFGAVASFILAFIHPWRSTKNFVKLLIAAILGLVLFGVLHNVFYGLADMADGIPILQNMLKILDVASFLIALLICPPAIMIGLVGSIVMLIRNPPLSTHED